MRLIDGDALKNQFNSIAFDDWNQGVSTSWANAFKEAAHVVETMPTIETPKRGHWVKVSGYATPGGDPVWCCSECGKGTHVYGIEHGTYGNDVSDSQWVACPNCGALMI